MAQMSLEGVRVIDLTVAWAGPYATMFLADLGAEVIRIESSRKFPSSTRGMMAYPTRELAERMGPNGRAYPDVDPGPRPYNRHAMFNSHGRGKKSCTAELDTPEGRELFHRLVAVSDVVIENNTVRVGDKLGVNYDELRAINPRVIVIRMPPMGLSGPLADAVGFGMQYDALLGLTLLRSYIDADPALTTGHVHMDDTSGPSAAFAVMAALYERDQSGEGMLIEFTQTTNLLQQIGEVLIDHSMNGTNPGPHGNTHPFYLQGCYPCTGDDEWIVLTIEDDHEWGQLTELMGRPEWATQSNFATVAGRRKHQAELDRLLAGWTRTQEKHTLFHRLQALHIAAAPVMKEPDAFADPHLQERGFFRPLTHPEAGTHLHPGHLWKTAPATLRWGEPAPCLGEHNEYVYMEVCGFSQDEYDALVERGLVGKEFPR